MVDKLYSSKSSADKGTLFQLKELINRTSFGNNPKNNMKATESFLEVILFAHVITASNQFISSSRSETADVHDIAQKISAKFVKLTVPAMNEDSNEETTSPVHVDQDIDKDHVLAYAVDLLTITLFWYGFRDAIREGDGNRIVRYWKFLLAIFRAEKHYNYANEGFNLIIQTVLLSPRQVSEIMWSRTVNTSGIKGKNIPVDLHMEHLNRRLKIMLQNLRSNVNPSTAQRAAKGLGVVQKVCTQFMAETDITENKDFHTIPCIKKDLSYLIKQLTDSEIFQLKHGRQYNIYNNHKPLFHSINWSKINDWVREKINDYN